jgi:hypothetical protein
MSLRCKNGHVKSGRNVIIDEKGHLRCRLCKIASRPKKQFRRGKWPRKSLHVRLRAKRRIVWRGWTTACWEFTGAKNEQGYGQIWYKGRQRIVHRLIGILCGVVKNRSKQAQHKCDNPPCFRPSHLKQGTPTENMRDYLNSKNRRLRCKEEKEARGHPRPGGRRSPRRRSLRSRTT